MRKHIMKKFIIKLILCIFLLFAAAAGQALSCFAAQPEVPELRFVPEGGGRFIYCNNNEFIRRDHLADSNNPNPKRLFSRCR